MQAFPSSRLNKEIFISVAGCVVAVIVWDDQSSWNTPYIGDILEKGMMLTHDEATYKFFDGIILMSLIVIVVVLFINNIIIVIIRYSRRM